MFVFEGLLRRTEVASKPPIMVEGKARAGLETERTRRYVSILSQLGTQPSAIRGGFEATSISIQ